VTQEGREERADPYRKGKKGVKKNGFFVQGILAAQT
jgi:hypothetical protein